MTEFTRILNAIEHGDPSAPQQLLPLVYDELRQLAAKRMAQEKPGQTLDATALVHEAYVRLVSGGKGKEAGRQGDKERGRQRVNERPPVSLSPCLPVSGSDAPLSESSRHWDSRGHFFAAAAEAMRRILVERARRKKRERHGGRLERVDLLDIAHSVTPDDQQILLLDDALTRLAAVRPQAAQVVQLRFFSGCTLEEAASTLGVSERTARRLWVFARAWLRREMEALAKRAD